MEQPDMRLHSLESICLVGMLEVGLSIMAWLWYLRDRRILGAGRLVTGRIESCRSIRVPEVMLSYSKGCRRVKAGWQMAPLWATPGTEVYLAVCDSDKSERTRVAILLPT